MLNIFKTENRDNLWKAIIRPPKFIYKLEDLGTYKIFPCLKYFFQFKVERNFH